jgi:RHS repeat-associated protein
MESGPDWGIGGTLDQSFGFHGFVGLGLGPAKAGGTVGVGFGYGKRFGDTVVSMFDLNGDGLPDRIYDGKPLVPRGAAPDAILFNQGAGRALLPVAPAGDPAAGAGAFGGIGALGGRRLGKDSGTSIDASLQAFYGGGSLNFGASFSSSKSSDFVIDANGDGLPDFVNGGAVFFNQPRQASCPTGVPAELCCPAGGFCFLPSLPVPALQDLGDSAGLVTGDPTVADANQAMAEALTPEDAVLEWTAPFDGFVDVAAELAFVAPQVPGDRRDGVRLRVYRYDPFAPDPAAELRATFLKPPDDAGATPVRLPSERVRPGTILYFVVSTLGDFPMNGPAGEVTPLERVRFAPIITYRGQSDQERGMKDVAGGGLFEFDAAEDFVLAGNPQGAVTMPRSGRIQLALGLTKGETSDGIRLCVQYQAPGTASAQPPAPGRCSATDAVYLQYSADRTAFREVLPAPELTVEAGSRLYFRIDTDVAIDPKAVKWSVGGAYSCIRGQGSTSTCVPPDPQETPQLTFQALPYFPLHEALDPTPAGRWRPQGAVLKPFVPRVPGTIQVGSSARYASRTTPIHFTIRTPSRSLFKVQGDHGQAGIDDGTSPVQVSAHLGAGEQVFFEGHTESLESLQSAWHAFDQWSAPLWSVTCVFRPDDPGLRAEDCSGHQLLTTDRTVDGFDGGNQPVLSGGHHGWRYGAWGGKDGEAFQPWVYRGMSKAEARAGWNPDEGEAAVGRKQKDKMKNKEDPQRVRLRLLGLTVPSARGTRLQPDQPAFETEGEAFVTQDGNTYFMAGVVHAGRKGESPSSQPKAPGATTSEGLVFKLGQIGRSSTSTSVSAGLGLGIGPVSVGGSLSAGMSGQKVDVLDMNGDGILDVVVSPGLPSIIDARFRSADALVNGSTPSEVRVTSPVTLATARKLTMNGYSQVSYDVAGQVNMGVSAPMRDLEPDGDTRAMVSRFPGFGGGLAFSTGTVVEQLVDVNGDGLPDAVRRSTTGCPSGIGVHLNMGTSFALGEDCLEAPPSAVGGGLTGVKPGGDRTDADTDQGADLVSGVASLSGLRQSTTVTLQGTSGAELSAVTKLEGGHDASEAFGLSIAMETSLTTTNVALVDVTGDGLPDYVYKANGGSEFLVRVNRGFDFTEARRWRAARPWPVAGDCPPELSQYCPAREPRLHMGKILGTVLDAVAPGANDGVDPIEATGSHSTLPSVSFSFDFAFPIVIIEPWLHIGAGFSATPQKVGGFELGLQDIDGDGLPDHVLKTSDNKPIWARLNQLGKANLLKRVRRPLGGSIDIAYDQREGNTVEMPHSRWVMTHVTIHDGRPAPAGEPGHDLTTAYGYQHGRHDRIEREFLGFEKVTRTNPDGTSVEQVFDNASVVTKGLLRSERLLGSRRGGGDRPVWVETVNGWTTRRKSTPADGCLRTKPILLDPEVYCGSFFNELTSVQKTFREGEATPGIVTRQELDYDAKGDVVALRDVGDVADPADDLSASIAYALDGGAAADLWSVSRPRTVDVVDAGGRALRSRAADYDVNGNLKTLTAALGDGRFAVTELSWNLAGPARGTLDWVKGADNGQGQRYQTWYGYDEVASTWATSIRDSHQYTSSAAYDLRFGEATRTTDVNGRSTTRQLDAYGRLERLAGPRDTLDAPTVWIDYAHGATVPYARTHNRLPRKAGDRRGTVDTVVVMDGLGRVVQTKKTAEMATSETTRGVGWSVSGHQVFDLMGRVQLQGQTFASFSSRPEFVPGRPTNPTRLLYDDLGRMIETVEPNGALTRVAYGFGTPAGTLVRRFKTTTTDAEGRSKSAYKDASDRVVAMEERIEGRTPTTHYQYSPVGDLLRVVDAAGNLTRLEYDLLGRRTRLENPDTGALRFELAPAGNMVRKYDANLDASRSAQRWIAYTYDHDQLVGISYPDMSRDVVYTYGKAGTDEERNGVGRVIEVKDDAGRELRTYGELDELASSTRLLRPLRPGDRERTFKTSFTHDAFGRMLTITYPDDEVVEYEYDAGGLLERATGHRGTGAAVPGDEVYLASIAYDEFGQRVRMTLGNGVVTSYGYEPLTRRLHTLTTSTPLQRKLQAITYGYDLVGNVRTMVNALGEPVGDRSGEVRYEYGYDELYRLTWANGQAKARPHTIDRFTARYAYSDVHNMTSNVQVHEILHGGADVSNDRPPKTNHDFAYAYDPAHPHQATRIGDTSLVYDGNGNTVRECRDRGDPTCQAAGDHLRRYAWTEENRLDQVIDGGGRNITRFVYDAAGDRVVKLGRGGESITIGQFWSLKGRRAATKHVFAGATRLASKLLPPPGWDDRPRGAEATQAVTVAGATNTNGCDPSDYQPQKCPVLPGGDPVINHQYDDTRVRPETYYYHPDHLGSTSWVTDQHARVHEHVDYFPYGEVWRDPRSDSDGGPVKGQRFLFTGKELDEETGLVYFGARYYDAARARWAAADPALEMYLPRGEQAAKSPLPGGGGVFRPGNLSLYSYALSTPVGAVDLDGRVVIIIHGTWAKGAEWAREPSPFVGAVESTFNDKAVAFEWSGQNTGYARSAAAIGLLWLIEKFPEDEPVVVVAHSHGGNVVKEYTQLPGARRVNVVVTLGTPQRDDYQMSMSRVGEYINVYSVNDEVQGMGGNGLTGNDAPWGESGGAGRKDPSASHNIPVNYVKKNGKLAPTRHGDLHTEDAWGRAMEVYFKRVQASEKR